MHECKDARLERNPVFPRVGARLFERHRESYALTAAGETMRGSAERVEAEMATLECQVFGEDVRLIGTVRLTTRRHLGTLAARAPGRLSRDLSRHNVGNDRRLSISEPVTPRCRCRLPAEPRSGRHPYRSKTVHGHGNYTFAAVTPLPEPLH